MTIINNDDIVDWDLDEDLLLVRHLTIELSNVAKDFIGKGVSPDLIIKSLETACNMAVKKIEESSRSMKDLDVSSTLSTFLATQLPNKPFGPYRQHLAKLIVGAVLATAYDYVDDRPFIGSISDLEDGSDLIELKKVPRGEVEDSFFVEGALFRSRESCADEFEKLKVVENPKILLLDVKPDRKSKKKDRSHYDANIYTMVDKYVNCGANVVLSRQAICDDTKKYLAERDIIYADRVAKDDLNRVARATGATVISVNYFSPIDLGNAECLEEKIFGNEVFGVFSKCSGAKRATLVLHGDDEFIEEAESYLPEVIASLRSDIKDYKVVVGGRTLYTKICEYLYDKARDVAKDSQPIIIAFANAIQTISDRTCDNVGCDAVNKPGAVDIWEPPSLKIHTIIGATKFVCIDLRYPTSSDDEEASSKKKTKRGKRKRRR